MAELDISIALNNMLAGFPYGGGWFTGFLDWFIG